ncbi:GNAT family N-acetyltransferase [Virgisporangium ochraceum]|uniref:GCN5 family N-acetyltransferase n=1 Tax=Virgisporangium ochraceum TaxID=65505 RepID=A0A8J3ZP75_9ACTN|nr:GNAT family N-acetyltransferase [Virgisporangium ochraceum]GIJ67291.1 GCN5 family N-acetyltransferase [Virgisporangium ochraceum]
MPRRPARVRETDRLRLEPVTERHGAELLALYSDPAVADWYGEWTREGTDREAARMADGWRTDGVHKWFAFHRGTGDPVGRGGLSRVHIDGAARLELGWVLHHRFWGHGYATEIGRAGLEVAFTELDAAEVVAFTEVHNARSRAVMERLGMVYAKDIEWDGAPFVLYRKIRGLR